MLPANEHFSVVGSMMAYRGRASSSLIFSAAPLVRADPMHVEV